MHPPIPRSKPGTGCALAEGGQLTAYGTGRESRAIWPPDMPSLTASQSGIDSRKLLQDGKCSRLFEAGRANKRAALVTSQPQAFPLPPCLLAHEAVTLAAEFPATPTESGKAPASGTQSIRRCAMSRTFSTGCGEVTAARAGRPGSRRLDQLLPSLDAAALGRAKRPDLPVRRAGCGQPAHPRTSCPLLPLVTGEGRIGPLDSRALTDARVKEFGAYPS